MRRIQENTVVRFIYGPSECELKEIMPCVVAYVFDNHLQARQ
jgi:hypothetical protein